MHAARSTLVEHPERTFAQYFSCNDFLPSTIAQAAADHEGYHGILGWPCAFVFRLRPPNSERVRGHRERPGEKPADL